MLHLMCCLLPQYACLQCRPASVNKLPLCVLFGMFCCSYHIVCVFLRRRRRILNTQYKCFSELCHHLSLLVHSLCSSLVTLNDIYLSLSSPTFLTSYLTSPPLPLLSLPSPSPSLPYSLAVKHGTRWNVNRCTDPSCSVSGGEWGWVCTSHYTRILVGNASSMCIYVIKH